MLPLDMPIDQHTAAVVARMPLGEDVLVQRPRSGWTCPSCPPVTGPVSSNRPETYAKDRTDRAVGLGDGGPDGHRHVGLYGVGTWCPAEGGGS